MSGTTRTVQQPLDTHNVLAVLGMAAAALAATVAIAWGSANLGKTAPAALPAPAAISDPALRDLGARDLGAAAKPVQLPASDPRLRDLGARDTGAASVSIGANHGAPGAYRPVITTSGGSSTLVKDDVAIKSNVIAGFKPGFLVDADQRRMQSSTNAATGFLPGSLGYADYLRMQNIFASEGAPATRHAGLRAQ